MTSRGSLSEAKRRRTSSFEYCPRFEKRFETIRSLAPTTVLSSHLPPARAMTDTLVATLIGARKVAPFVGPNQVAFEQMLHQAAE